MSDRERLTRRQALGALAGGAVALGAARAYAPRSLDPRPNLLFILADDLGYGDLGCFGQSRIATPHLDRLAARGTRFTACYAGSTVCAPSRCCLMTGRHTGHARIRGNADVPLRPEDVTVAEVLQDAGYATGLVGKWGCGEAGSTGIPGRQGFDEFFGYLNQTHAHNSYPSWLWRGETKVALPNVVPQERPTGAGVASVRRAFSNDLFVAEGRSFIRRHRHQPWFLYQTFTLPHANNEGGQAAGMEVPTDGRYRDQPWPQPQRNHAAMITRLDDYVGQLVAELAQHGLLDSTLILFTSDNGPHKEGGADPAFFDSSGPFRGYKRALYEGGIRVPAVASWPGHVPAGQVCGQPWAFWDVLPTAAELAGERPPAGLDGESVVGLLTGRPQGPHAPLYWEFHEGGFSQAVRLGSWKVVRNKRPDAPVELYDLVSDPGETQDVGRRYPAIRDAGACLLTTLRTDSPDFPVRPARA